MNEIAKVGRRSDLRKKTMEIPNNVPKQHRGRFGILGGSNKSGDFNRYLFLAKTHDYVLFFTNKGQAYMLRGYQIPEDGRKANELRRLNIHEVSLVMYPANPDTSVIEVKSGRRNSAKDADAIREAITLLQGVLGELEDNEPDEESKAKSEEPDTVNDEEQKRIKELMTTANKLLEREE